MTNVLFDKNTVKRDFTVFDAQGFSKPVPGIVFTNEDRPCCGVPLGGIGTGCIDYDLRGIFGWSSIFNPVSPLSPGGAWNGRMPRRLPDVQPIFGFGLNGKNYILTTEEITKGGEIEWCTAPLNYNSDRKDYLNMSEITGVIPASRIYYYGHYPVADSEYEFDDAPVNIGVRAWSSFIPGDSAKTNIPAAIFEVHIRNVSKETQSGTFAMNFAGPNYQEARARYFCKTRIEDENAAGMYVCSDGGVNYFLGTVCGEEHKRDVLTGTGLSENKNPDYGYGEGYFGKQNRWANLSETSELPQDKRFIEINGQKKYSDPSASTGIKFSIDPGEEKICKFILSWYAPVLNSATRKPNLGIPFPSDQYEVDWQNDACYGDQAHYYQMYASRYDSALDVMRRVARDGDMLLKKIFKWQEVLLTREDLPGWLRDSLLNILCQCAENGYWFMPKYPMGDWSFPDGAFTYYESARDCPHSSCIPNNYIGSMHIAYFFPDLYLQMLRSYKAVQRNDGEIPFAVGMLGDLPNFALPEYTWQMSLNGTCYIMMVDRLWNITKDDKILDEFYESIKKCHDFMAGLAHNGWLCIPDRGGSEWFELSKFYGYASHVGGLHLAQLLIVERMAKKMGDTDYASKCRKDYEEATKILNDKLWMGTHYMTWLDEAAERKNDDVMAYQLDGLYAIRQTGIFGEDIYPADRIKTVIETIYGANVKLGNGYGALNYARADGTYMKDLEDNYGKYSIFAQCTIIFAMTCMYCEGKERSLALAESTWRNLVLKQGLGWDMTHIVHATDGHKVFGADYDQMSVIWSLPAALENKSSANPCEPGGLVYDMLNPQQ